MNTQLCPAPLAVDEFVLFPRSLSINSTSTTDELCDTNLIAFVTWFAILTVIKIITGLGLSFDWYSRYISAEGRAHLARRHNRRNVVRYPIVPSMNVVQAVLFLVLLVLSSSNACTSRTGCPLAFYSLQHALSAAYCIILLRQFIALGKRMIPLARSKLALLQGADGNSSSSSTDRPAFSGGTGDSSAISGAVMDALSKEDLALKVLIYVQGLCVFAQLIPGTILFQIRLPDMLLNGAEEEFNLLISAMYGTQTVFFLFNLSGYLVQLQRLIAATRMGCAKPYSKDVQVALSKMRQTQVGFVLVGGMALILSLLVAVQAISPRWFVLLLLMTMETMGTTLTFVKFALGRLMKMRRKRQKRRGVDDNAHLPNAPRGEAPKQASDTTNTAKKKGSGSGNNNKVASVSNDETVSNQQVLSSFIVAHHGSMPTGDLSSLVAFSASDQQQTDS